MSVIQHTNTREDGFEQLIERALVGTTIESRRAQGIELNAEAAAAQTPSAENFYWGLPKDFLHREAVDERRLWSFLTTTQADLLDQWRGRGGSVKDAVIKELKRTIESRGVLDILKNGLEVDNLQASKRLRLFYPKPTAADSAESHTKYASNQFSITRQAIYSLINPGNEIDMVVFVNGLPLFTFELKNPWTGQTAAYNGRKQYREHRDPRDPLLMFGRCLAHFAVDKDEIWFTTKLKGKDTYFMPFNQGLPYGAGAGNPVNPNGMKTSYLWERILRKDVIAEIISNFALFDYGEAKTGKKVPHILKNAKLLIFPRFHQLDVVDKLMEDVETEGIGKRYLIQHSAGSGKSNSITWLAFKLIKAMPRSLNVKRAKALDTPLFNTVIVVVDRKILDRQLTLNVKAFANSDKIISHADTSAQLRQAIEDGKRIVITTIQKFPYIVNDIKDMSGNNFAILIDEAHSSQSGIAADKLNAAIASDPDLGGADTDQFIDKLIQERKMSENASYFAFTATPKRETLERFGIQQPDGSFRPFHLYSMRQAIEEGFILDVVTNYTTYHSFYEVVKVTKDIECAIRYYHALRKLAEKMHLRYNILVAFSGEKTVDGVPYTERGLNGFADTKTAEEFDKDDNRILVVANKYLTGFDQPKLAVMYVDKPLGGVLAVQTLSRLNRNAPDLGKRSEDVFVLDFFNTVEGIKEAFDPFYTSTTLEQATDPNVLSELRHTLLDLGVFTDEEIEEFNDLYLHGADQDRLAPLLDAAQHRYDEEIEWPENGKADFKMKCKQFVKVYSRIAAIMAFDAPAWEKMYWYLRHLIPQLRVPENGGIDVSDLLDKTDLNTYCLSRTALNEQIVLNAEEAIINPLAPTMVNAGGTEEDRTQFDIILQHFNERHMNGWDATPEEQRTKVIRVAELVRANARYLSQVVGNPDTEAADRRFQDIIDEIMLQQRSVDMSLYREFRNEGFRHDFINLVRAALENGDRLSDIRFQRNPDDAQ